MTDTKTHEGGCDCGSVRWRYDGRHDDFENTRDEVGETPWP